MGPDVKDQLFTLKETADRLGLDTEKLILLNENNILKPTITPAGEVGYREEQINQFLAIQKQLLRSDSGNTYINRSVQRSFGGTTILVFVLSFSTTVILTTVILKSLPNSSGGQGVKSASEANLLDPLGSAPISIPAPQLENNLSANNVTYSEKETPDSVFNSSGSIKGNTTDADVLAANTLANGMIQSSSPVRQTADLNLLLVILALGSLAMPFIFRKQPAYSTVPTSGDLIGPEEQKILEVNQKTDGTVVLCFQGQEYKVSKPELDSESDQFIERLMGLVEPGVKEIDYDAITDDRIKLSAPLSKIVTRLGFVGIKRDLFFPRTSKNRVLFRRYLTRGDIIAMNLNLDQIKSEFFT